MVFSLPAILLIASTRADAKTHWSLSRQGEVVGVNELGLPINDFEQMKMNIQYQQLRPKLARKWSVAARTIVGDALHANLATLSLGASQVISEWNAQVQGRLDRDRTEYNNMTSSVFMTSVGVLSFNVIPGSNLAMNGVQNMVFQVLMRWGLPVFLQDAGHGLAELPSRISAALQGAAIDRLDGELQETVDQLLAQVAFEYIEGPNRMKDFEADSEDQSAQLRILSRLAGKPAKLSDVTQGLRASRDFRLVYAAKVAPMIGDRYEEPLNSFIVTGLFAELAWARGGASVRGAIYDLYVRSGESAYETTTMGIPVDNRRKRVWKISPSGRLVPQDRGRFTEGRLMERTRLVLPYWDEPVAPYGASTPVLKAQKVSDTF